MSLLSCSFIDKANIQGQHGFELLVRGKVLDHHWLTPPSRMFSISLLLALIRAQMVEKQYFERLFSASTALITSLTSNSEIKTDSIYIYKTNE